MEENVESLPKKIEQLEQYFAPQTLGGQKLYRELPQRPLYPYEQIALTSWVRLSEEGQADQNFLQNLSNFLGQVSLQRRVRIRKEEEERGIIPQPLLFDEGRLLIRGALEQFRRRRFLEQSGAQSTIRQSLRLLVGLLVDNNLLKKSLKKKIP